jgi:hypothetical protein
MLLVTIAAARWIVMRLTIPARWSARLGMGALALGLLLIAEFALLSPVRGLSIKEYFTNRDPVAGGVYYAMLLLFALMPLFVARRDPTSERRE